MCLLKMCSCVADLVDIKQELQCVLMNLRFACRYSPNMNVSLLERKRLVKHRICILDRQIKAIASHYVVIVDHHGAGHATV